MRRRHHRPRGCHKPVKQIVHPTKHNVVHCCTEETIKHVHPSHTTVCNHHLIKNEHVFPHSTSVKNSCKEVNVGGCGCGCQGTGHMMPGMKHCSKPKYHHAGMMKPGMNHYMHHHYDNGFKHDMWAGHEGGSMDHHMEQYDMPNGMNHHQGNHHWM